MVRASKFYIRCDTFSVTVCNPRNSNAQLHGLALPKDRERRGRDVRCRQARLSQLLGLQVLGPGVQQAGEGGHDWRICLNTR